MLKDVKYFIIDMDGTFYLGDNMIEGANEFTDALPTTKVGKINYRVFERKKETPEETKTK